MSTDLLLAQHAAERAAERLSHLPADVRADCILRASAYAAEHPTGDHAVRVASLPHYVGSPWSDESNGDTVWAIVRSGTVQTFMFRRRSQPVDKARFNVRFIHLAD